MHDAADFVDDAQLAEVIAQGWGLQVSDLRYLPEGGGAYHWVASTSDGRRIFVTCDDLGTKPWLGEDHDHVFIRLTAAYDVAMQLRDLAGLDFVCAPVAGSDGAPAVRLDVSHSVAVLPFVDGHAGSWGRAFDVERRRDVLRMLASLHAMPLDVAALPTPGMTIGNRAELDGALDDLGNRWGCGPFADEARQILQHHAARVRGWLDQLESYRPDPAAEVLTHGEPHPGNLMHTVRRLVLLDWDTIAIAPPERDLWMLSDGGEDAFAVYAELTGRRPDPDALSAYRLLWALSDLAAFTAQLRRPHERTADATRAFQGIQAILAGTEPAPWG